MTQSAGGTKMFWTKKEKPMFKEIEAFAEKVAEKVKSAEAEIKQYFNDKKARAVAQLKFDLEHFEAILLMDGIKLDDEFSADLAKIKAKLEAAEASLGKVE